MIGLLAATVMLPVPVHYAQAAKAERPAVAVAAMLLSEDSLTRGAKALWDQIVADSPEWRTIVAQDSGYSDLAWARFGTDSLTTVREALPGLRLGLAEIIEKRLTQAEIQALIRFYRTSTGQAALSEAFGSLSLPAAERQQMLKSQTSGSASAEDERIAAVALPAIDKIRAAMPEIHDMLHARMKEVYAVARPQAREAAAKAAQQYRDDHGASGQ